MAVPMTVSMTMSMPVRRALHAVGVVQPGRCADQVAVPNLVGAFAQEQVAHPQAIENAQFNRLGMR